MADVGLDGLVAEHESRRDLAVGQAFRHKAKDLGLATTDRMLAAFSGDLGMPIGPWQGLGVAFAWAFGTLACGFLLMRTRDA